MIELAAIAAVAFAATNIDDAFVLLGLFASARSDIVIYLGTYIGMAILVIAALLLSAVCAALFPNNLGLLGALPILVGLRQLWTAWSDANAETVVVAPGTGAFEAVELIAIRTLANGSDNVAVYIPLFAKQSRSDEILTCLVFAVLVGAWCFGAKFLVARAMIGDQIRRWGRWITPVVLIALGAFVFFSSDALVPQLP